MNRRNVSRAILALAAAGCAGIALSQDTKPPTPRELRAFQLRCLKIGRELHPGMDLTAPADDPEILRSGEIELSLQNVRKNFLLSDQSESALTDLVRRLLSLAPAIEKQPDALPPFEQARPKLMPQLMPPGYVSLGANATFPFGADVLVGIVIDNENNYQYVREQELTQWQMKKEALLPIAIENLERLGQPLSMEVSTAPQTRYVAIEKKDSYDAARILIPGIREFISARLGLPFLFGIPNRDFLICWAADNSKDFQSFVRKQLAEDFQSQPYRLSNRVFEVTDQNEIRLSEG